MGFAQLNPLDKANTPKMRPKLLNCEFNIKALIFDFDGLILDTESPTYQAWQEIYQSYGCSLPLPKWVECIGSAETFDPHEYLEEQFGQLLDRAAIRDKRRARFAELMANQSILPGVEQHIADARRLGLKLGVASSSPRSWVSEHLSRFGLEDHFDAIKCANDVKKIKPAPEEKVVPVGQLFLLYLAALHALGIVAREAIVFEDSLNGVLATKRAGVFCVAVPNPLMRQFSYDLADLRLSSLADVPLDKRLEAATAERSL
jgi:HAD superfamily hydrolase (TIGR01509 family)